LLLSKLTDVRRSPQSLPKQRGDTGRWKWPRYLLRPRPQEALENAPHQVRAAEIASRGNLRRRFAGLFEQRACCLIENRG
jgi:hypothetical protein